jgi:RNA polymerase sigma factor (sigma-70 family)
MTREEFDRHVRTHRSMFLGVAARIVGNHDDAEDVVQWALIDAWRKIEEGAIIRSFHSYVSKMTQFRARRVVWLRKTNRYEEVSYEEWGEENSNHSVSTDVNLTLVCEEGQTKREILDLASRAKVSDKQLTRLWQREYYEMSGGEIAAHEGTHSSSVNAGIKTAIEWMRREAGKDTSSRSWSGL